MSIPKYYHDYPDHSNWYILPCTNVHIEEQHPTSQAKTKPTARKSLRLDSMPGMEQDISPSMLMATVLGRSFFQGRERLFCVRRGMDLKGGRCRGD